MRTIAHNLRTFITRHAWIVAAVLVLVPFLVGWVLGRTARAIVSGVLWLGAAIMAGAALGYRGEGIR